MDLELVVTILNDLRTRPGTPLGNLDAEIQSARSRIALFETLRPVVAASPQAPPPPVPAARKGTSGKSPGRPLTGRAAEAAHRRLRIATYLHRNGPAHVATIAKALDLNAKDVSNDTLNHRDKIFARTDAGWTLCPGVTPDTLRENPSGKASPDGTGPSRRADKDKPSETYSSLRLRAAVLLTEHGPMTVKELAQRLAITASKAQTLTANSHYFCRSQGNPQMLTLTPAGRQFAAETRP